MGGRRVAFLLIAFVGCSFEHGVSPDELGDGGYHDAVGTGLDAAVGTTCYGPTAGAWRVCLGSTPTGSVMLPPTLDTDTSSLCLQAQPAGWTAGGQSPGCFIVGNAIATTNTVVTGGRPLVLLSAGTIMIGNLDLESHAGSSATGPGADPSVCKPFASPPQSGDGSGGGAGGSFMTAGGDGGKAGDKNGGRAATADGSAPAVLRGGCRGQKGGGYTGGAEGHGGGAAYLVAGTSIMVTGTINASGAGGSPGNNNKPGGGGGGSGGMLVFYAPLIAVSGTVFANGGGGAGGGDGQPGSDPSFAGVVASGGNPNGGDGYALTVNASSGSSSDNGGGGGGGGAGYIRSNLTLGATSPPADLVP